MQGRSPLFVYGLLAALLASWLPASAERPLLDYHRLDAYFTLFARDTSVPWKPATVRLDTYTSAPVDFAAYQVDPADVIVAGSTALPRAVDTRRLHAVARWRYTPPGGYRFQSNDVDVPLGSREGFFVIEARRGNVGEQVWIDRTRVGLLTKETSNVITLYGADLGSGKPLGHMRVSFIVNGRFVDRYTGWDGLVQWRSFPRPVFALAAYGNSVAFVSFLPQAPLPHTIVGVNTDSAVVHAGGDLHVAGFARSLGGERLRAAGGEVSIMLRSPSALEAQTSVRLDAAGAFNATLHVPQSSRAGEYTVMASADGATAGTAVHVDADADGLSLELAPQCEGTACDPNADIPVVVRATRAGAPVDGASIDVAIVRSPHVYAAGATQTPWGIAHWYRTVVQTNRDGRALIDIPHPSDGLGSTYGVRVDSGGATADTRIAVPTAPITLRVQMERDDIGSGTPASFDVYGTRVATGAPASNVSVRVQLIHGNSIQQQQITLDEHGHARGAFTAPQPGSNLVVASANVDGSQAMDAAQVQVEPQTMETQDAQGSTSIRITLDRKRYAAGEYAHVDAQLAGAQGTALFTLETPERTETHAVNVSDGRAGASFRIGDSSGVLAAGAAFVRDGALQWSSVPLIVDAPGRPLTAQLELDKGAYEPGATALVTIGGVRPGTGTVFVRITKGTPTGSALFTSAPELLAIGTTATQDTATDGASWHPWVDSTGAHALIQTFTRRTAPPDDLTMTQADTASVYWKVDRHSGDSLDVPVPDARGTYVISLLKVDDDGRVTAASADLKVE
ncbi:MAG TPA: hypothetical protein VKT72_15095 [Candidatus Baltobacteraceae bacterium]|nr:hypothetical protein [Candidatus Baltobacteraceae bacterium]